LALSFLDWKIPLLTAVTITLTKFGMELVISSSHHYYKKSFARCFKTFSNTGSTFNCLGLTEAVTKNRLAK
jgi:hypothetical protein